MPTTNRPASAGLKLPMASALALISCLAQANPGIEEVIVFGRAQDLIGRVDSASQGEVSGADLLVRPMLKTAELLEAMPGMVAVQHSGSGKANQYFLRGFNLDHGTDFTAYVDGMPWNLRSHGHGQGYLDVNGLIPETVARIDYRKGPYYADAGDFALAGASRISTIDRLEASFVSLEAGQYGWGRLAAGHSLALGQGTLTLVADAKTYDGPWQHEESLRHLALWSKYQVSTDFGQAAYTLSVYDGNWHPTEQIPERAIGTAVCSDAYCALDDSAGGDTRRWIAGAQFQGQGWEANLYGQYYDWAMESNPTYDFQINQFDRRYTFGGNGSKVLVDNGIVRIRAGGNFQYDAIGPVGLDHHDRGRFVDAISSNDIEESSAGAFTDLTWFASDSLRLMAGVRGDHYRFDVTANNAGAYEGAASDTQVSPKAGIAYAVSDAFELYGNWGRGFHSNDARGVVNAVDPVPGLSQGAGHEFGARATLGEVQLTATYWWLDQDSELIFVGDSNSVEPKGGSEREGYELTLFWQPWEGVGVDAVYTRSRARYTDNAEGVHVENAVEEAAQIGISAVRGSWEASARARYLGAYALTADNNRRSQPLTTVNARGAYHWDALTFYAEVINLLDNDGKEITYYYPAHIPGLDPEGLTADDIDCDSLDCTMGRVTEPRTLRFGVSYRF